MAGCVDAEFIVAAPNVLHERVTSRDYTCCVVALEASHRAEPRLESSVVGYDPIVRVLVGVVERGRHQLINDLQQCPRPIGHDLSRIAMIAQRIAKKRRAARVSRRAET